AALDHLDRAGDHLTAGDTAAARDAIDDAVDAAFGGPVGPRPDVAGTHRPAPGQVHHVFDGADAGMGHHPTNYALEVGAVGAPAAVGFLASLGGRSGTRTGRISTIDVSVPIP